PPGGPGATVADGGGGRGVPALRLQPPLDPLHRPDPAHPLPGGLQSPDHLRRLPLAGGSADPAGVPPGQPRPGGWAAPGPVLPGAGEGNGGAAGDPVEKALGNTCPPEVQRVKNASQSFAPRTARNKIKSFFRRRVRRKNTSP